MKKEHLKEYCQHYKDICGIYAFRTLPHAIITGWISIKITKACRRTLASSTRTLLACLEFRRKVAIVEICPRITSHFRIWSTQSKYFQCCINRLLWHFGLDVTICVLNTMFQAQWDLTLFKNISNKFYSIIDKVSVDFKSSSLKLF